MELTTQANGDNDAQFRAPGIKEFENMELYMLGSRAHQAYSYSKIPLAAQLALRHEQ